MGQPGLHQGRQNQFIYDNLSSGVSKGVWGVVLKCVFTAVLVQGLCNQDAQVKGSSSHQLFNFSQGDGCLWRCGVLHGVQ